MSNTLNYAVSEEEKEEIKDFITTLMLLTKEDREMLLANAHAFKVRSEIEKRRREF